MPVPPPTFLIAPGAVIAGRYRLDGLLGRGGMAEVYDGFDLRLRRPVAVKLLRPEMAAREEIRTRFEAEARAAAGLSHPNAVAVYDTGEHEGAPFLVMERLPGVTLADRIADGPVDPTWLRGAAEGLLGALAAAHEAGIVHRDVKPGNILLTADDRAKIADFGIAKSIHTADDGTGVPHVDLTATGQLLGTPNYLAPERIDGAPATPRSDLWALGAVLYEALAGQKPFTGRGPLDVARAVVAGDHIALGDVRPDLDPLLVATVERAMARQPEARFATAGEMAAALRGDGGDATIDQAGEPADGGTLVLPLDQAGLEAEPPPPVPVARPWRSALAARKRWVAWALIAALVVLVLVVLARADNRGMGATAGRTPSTTAPRSTTAPSAAQSLAQRLRDAAAKLDPVHDGTRAGELAAGLRRVADEVQAGSAGAAGDATGLVAAAAAWRQTGELSTAALVTALEALRQVPGVQGQATLLTPAPAPTAPATTARNSGGKGKGKGNDSGN